MLLINQQCVINVATGRDSSRLHVCPELPSMAALATHPGQSPAPDHRADFTLADEPGEHPQRWSVRSHDPPPHGLEYATVASSISSSPPAAACPTIQKDALRRDACPAGFHPPVEFCELVSDITR
ncbi:hypothetical protein AURDEDRAFT_161014 [Auricularia subglabra TFB-10046 SS5]|nr:hypothetical protein AURDEDRAFT_161014 [Auricularia subglabra TFB-10046 SS5]